VAVVVGVVVAVVVAFMVAFVVAVAACVATGTTVAASPASPVTVAPSLAQQVLARMTLRERVGQLLMAGVPTSGLSSADRSAIAGYHVGSIILDGTTWAGVRAIARLTTQAQSLSAVHLFVATDQEGGAVQRLRGPGFAAIPSAVAQASLPNTTLATDWVSWAHELREAGVQLDLAPVVDTVPPGFANPPIGELDREYGRTASAVSYHTLPVLRGMAAGHLDATAKHFPGIGRVSADPDTASGVTDTVTTRTDPYLAPFASAIHAGVPFVMVSTVFYTRIDAHHPAAFSPTVITGMLRTALGFRGVVISDDLGIAAQVASYGVGGRAVTFVAAGGDVVLTVDAGQIPAMSNALVAHALASPAFRAQVDAAALRVLEAKQARGLLG
jgi:beta-N-acetylhexosaminidase